MPCIFKQVLHFEISSRRDISRRLNISGSRIPQPSERKYRLRCIRLHSESQVCPRNCPLVSPCLLLRPPHTHIYPVHRSSWRSAEALHASHISSGLKPDRCHDAVINQHHAGQELQGCSTIWTWPTVHTGSKVLQLFSTQDSEHKKLLFLSFILNLTSFYCFYPSKYFAQVKAWSGLKFLCPILNEYIKIECRPGW